MKKRALDKALQEAAEDPGKVTVLFADEATFYRQPHPSLTLGQYGAATA